MDLDLREGCPGVWNGASTLTRSVARSGSAEDRPGPSCRCLDGVPQQLRRRATIRQRLSFVPAA